MSQAQVKLKEELKRKQADRFSQRITNIEALRLWRRAGRRMKKVLQQASRYLQKRRQAGDAVYIIRDFMQVCLKWKEFLEYAQLAAQAFDGDFNLRRIFNNMNYFIDNLRFPDFRDDYFLCEIICAESVRLNRRLTSYLSGESRGEPENPCQITILKKNLPRLYKFLNFYTIAEHRFYPDEVPMLKVALDRKVFTYDDEDLTDKSLTELAAITEARLLVMYDELLKYIARLGAAESERQHWQTRFDANSKIVEKCLYLKQEKKNGSLNGSESAAKNKTGPGKSRSGAGAAQVPDDNGAKDQRGISSAA